MGLKGSLRNVSTGVSAIPDSVTSRPADDDSASVSRSLGLAITPNNDFDAVGFRISANTVDATRARLYDYSQSAYVATKDISGLSAGDTETFNYGFVSGQDYGIELDNDGSTWTVGFASGDESTEYPFTGEDIDIIARSDEGVQDSSSDPVAVNDIGNTGF